MARRHVDLLVLNAYVDGELDAEETARVDAMAADDPDIARQLALLARLKAATAGSVEPHTIELAAPRRRPWTGLAVAATVALMVVGAAFWHLAAPTGPAADAIGFARAAHASWAGDAAQPRPDAELFLSGAPDGLDRAFLPDLAPARLRLAHAKVWRTSIGPVLVAGYLGTRGCRVTLMVQAAADAEDRELRTKRDGALLVADWTVGALDYAMIAEGMPAARFRSIVQSVRRSSVRHTPIDPESRMAMARARAASRPCGTA